MDSTENSVELGAAAPLQDWPKAPTVRDLKQDLTDAQPSHKAQVGKIEAWLDNLNVEGKAKVKTGDGNSKVVPKLIRKQAEWRYAALSEPFLSTEDLFKASPQTWEDVKSAEQNGLILNNQFRTEIDKTRFIDTYVRSAVDEGTVIVKVGWEFQEEQYTEQLPIVELTPDPTTGPLHEELHAMMAQDPATYELEVPEELKQAHAATMQDGVPYRPEIVGYEPTASTRTLVNRPTLEVCDYRNVVIDPSAQGDMTKASFVIYSFTSSLAELKKDGRYKNLDKINVEGSSVLGDPDHTSDDTSDFNFSDEPRKRLVVHEYWGFWDIHGKGVTVPIIATWVGDVMVRLEENPFPDKALPFVVVQYLPVRRSTYGEPDGALLEDNQRIIGAVTRGMIDLMAKSANSQTGIRKDALDVVNRRKFEKGLDYEFNANVDPRQAVFMHTFPEIPQTATYMLSYQQNEAESMSGVKAFHGGISGEALGDTATSVRGALDASSKRELGILRRLSAGLIEIGRKIIAMNAVFLEEEEVVRTTNEQFVQVRRDDLAGKIDLKLGISTAEEDNAKAQELAFMLQTMGNNMDPGMSKMILRDIAKLRKMPELAEAIENYQPQPDPLAERQRELELALLEAQIAEKQTQAQENQAEAMLDQARAMLEQVRAQQIQSDTDLKNLDFVEQESGVKQARELEKQGAQARANMDLESHKANLAERAEAKKELAKYLTPA